MNSHDVKVLKEALPILLKGTKIERFPEQKAIRMDIPFTMSDGSPVKVYAFRRQGSKKISLSTHLGIDPNETNLEAVQMLLKTYGLIITQDLAIAEESTRTLGKRVAALVQGVIAVDSLARGMELYGKLRRNAAAAGQATGQGGPAGSNQPTPSGGEPSTPR